VLSAGALLVVLGGALLMEAVGLSMAMGAFLAGVLLSGSSYRHQIESDVEPFKGLLMGLFFLAVGMSLDLGVIVAECPFLLAMLVVYVLVKAVAIYPRRGPLAGPTWRRCAARSSLRKGASLPSSSIRPQLQAESSMRGKCDIFDSRYPINGDHAADSDRRRQAAARRRRRPGLRGCGERVAWSGSGDRLRAL
jgi:hypothetical protein